MAGSGTGSDAAIAAAVGIRTTVPFAIVPVFLLGFTVGLYNASAFAVTVRGSFLASDDHVVLLTRERLGRDGAAFDADRVLVFRIRDDQLHECWVYDEDPARVDELLR